MRPSVVSPTTRRPSVAVPTSSRAKRRRPILTWVREIPVAGHPADVRDIITRYAAWLASSEIPNLRRGHFLVEDAADAIGAAIATWMRGIT